MKKLLMFFCLTASLWAADWEWLNPKPHGNSLNAVYTIDTDHAVAVGTMGTIMRTADNGAAWETIFQVNSLAANLNAVQFISASDGWAVGEWGTILKTTDGGATWEIKPSSTSHNLYAVYFTNADTGWVAGRWGKVLKTVDAGETWVEETTDTYRRLLSIGFQNSRNGIAVGHGGTIIKTADGGDTWQEIYSGVENNLHQVCFGDSGAAWIVGEGGTILKSRDNGNSWTSVPGNTDYDLAAISFADADTGWAVGYRGYPGDLGELYKTTGAILKTIDGGDSWTEVVRDSIYALNALSVQNDKGWAAGEAGTMIRLDKANDSFATGSQNNLPTVASLYFVDRQIGYAAGGNAVCATKDGGATWQTQVLPTRASFQLIKFANADKGYASGFYLVQTYNSIELEACIWGSNDGGATWDQVYFKTNDLLIGVETVNDSVAYAVGLTFFPNTGGIKGLVLKTTDGGKSWVSMPFSTATILYTASFVDANNGWAVGESGVVFHTTDGGATWERQNPRLQVNIYNNVHFIDLVHGWACGQDGTVIATTDGGLTWTQQTTNTYNFLRDVHFVDERTGYVVGDAATLLTTLDGGATWQAEKIATDANFYSVSFPTVSTGFVGGDRGIILQTTNAVSGVEEKEPQQNPGSYVLRQNFPNPFNPQTTIQFNLPRDGHATLKVFNVLGEQVATLVDAPLPAGEHYATFDAGGLASGLYFYRLTSGDFSQTKKMLVQK